MGEVGARNVSDAAESSTMFHCTLVLYFLQIQAMTRFHNYLTFVRFVSQMSFFVSCQSGFDGKAFVASLAGVRPLIRVSTDVTN